MNLTSSAPEIAAILEVSPRTVRLWSESNDLPRLERGQYDLAWATWLMAGRKVSADWRAKPTALVAVSAGWAQALGHAPNDADMAALCNLFKRNGYSAEHAMRSLGAAEVAMARR